MLNTRILNYLWCKLDTDRLQRTNSTFPDYSYKEKAAFSFHNHIMLVYVCESSTIFYFLTNIYVKHIIYIFHLVCLNIWLLIHWRNSLTNEEKNKNPLAPHLRSFILQSANTVCPADFHLKTCDFCSASICFFIQGQTKAHLHFPAWLPAERPAYRLTSGLLG